MTKREHGVAALIAVLVPGVGAAGIAQAATCMDELDRFERRLYDSTLASTDADAFQALVRQAEETAELRDEEQCLQGVAELNEALPEDAGTQPVTRESTHSGTRAAQDEPGRPKAPVLMIAGSDDASSDDEPAKTDDEDDDEDKENDSSDEDAENLRPW
jgi:pimeloyl-ACP methyl ester carboxylesterase